MKKFKSSIMMILVAAVFALPIFASARANVGTTDSSDIGVTPSQAVEAQTPAEEVAASVGGEISVSARGESREAEEYGAYLFAHFVGAEETGLVEQMYFSISKDGKDWEILNDGKPVMFNLLGEGGIRDPNIIRKHDNSGFYLIATDLSIYNINGDWGGSQSNGSRAIIVWESDGNSLTKWKTPRRCEIARPNATCTWAPEVIWDDEENSYMVFWASKSSEDWKHRIYRCYTDDFVTFSYPEVYIERDVSFIDTTFLKHDGVYYRFTKNEKETYMVMEKSTSLSGPFSHVSTFSLNGKTAKEVSTKDYYHGFEGATAFKFNGENKWCVLMDNNEGDGYVPFITDDLATGRFKAASGDVNFHGIKYRHGTVMPIYTSEYNALKAATWKSWDEQYGKEANRDPVIKLTFDNASNRLENTGSAAYTATATGTTTYESGYNGSAVKFTKTANNFLTLTGDCVKNKESFTVSFAVKSYDQGESWSWPFFAGHGTNSTSGDGHPKYLGIITQAKDGYTIRVERQNGWKPNVATNDFVFSKWQYITVVCKDGTTVLYIDGEIHAIRSLCEPLTEILGDSPIVYLGKATWAGGEYSDLLMDDFALYDYALTPEQVTALYNSVKSAA